MLFDIIGDVFVGLILVAVVYLQCRESAVLTPRDLRHRWRRSR